MAETRHEAPESTASTRRQLLLGGGVLALAGVSRLSPLAAVVAGGAPLSRRFLAAVIAGRIGSVRRFLERDPGLLSVRDEGGRSVFALAMLHRRSAVAEVLLQRGYRPDLHESALARDWERFETLAEESPQAVNRGHPIGGTAFFAAAVGGAGVDLFRVYRFGGDPNLVPEGSTGISPLRAALEHPDLSTAEITAAGLLANGAYPDPEPADSVSPLHMAAERGSLELVEMLVRKGASVDARDREGRRPVDRATAAGHGAVAELLRRHHTVPRDHSTSRRTYDLEGNAYRPPDLSAFSTLVTGEVVSAAHFDLDEVRRSVDRHPELAHAVATTTEGAVEACAHTGREVIVDYLLHQGVPYSLPTAVMRGDLGSARRLLEDDPLRIHERGPHDFALMWYPVIGGGRLDMAELLVERGAEVERQHYLGTTALHFAARSGQIEMVDWLVRHGADVDRVGRKFDPRGQTPLQLARERGHGRVSRLLVSRGARRDSADPAG